MIFLPRIMGREVIPLEQMKILKKLSMSGQRARTDPLAQVNNFFSGRRKVEGGGTAKGLASRAERPRREHGRGRAATGPHQKLA
jgi:hypothetical protein